MSALHHYIHSFVPASGAKEGTPPLLLLPRTGGTEATMIDMGRRLLPGAALLSLRGNVLEDGKPRFFARVARGEFDIEDFRTRTMQLAAFVSSAMQAYDIPAPIAVGHSNGANIAWSLIMYNSAVLAGAILYRPLMPIDPGWKGRADGLPVLIAAGNADIIAPVAKAEQLAAFLADRGADMTLKVAPAQHDLVAADHDLARTWLACKLLCRGNLTGRRAF